MAIGDLLEKVNRFGNNLESDSSTETDGADEYDDAGTETQLDVPSDILAPDPRPGERKSKRRVVRAAAKPSVLQKKRVEDALRLMVEMPAGIWEIRDPICGGAAAEQADAIVKAATPIVLRNPNLLAWFTGSGAPWMDYLALFLALKPVASTVIQHHVTHTIGGDDDEHGHTGQTDFSQYSAPSFG
jgi:hypothetical protein